MNKCCFRKRHRHLASALLTTLFQFECKFAFWFSMNTECGACYEAKTTAYRKRNVQLAKRNRNDKHQQKRKCNWTSPWPSSIDYLFIVVVLDHKKGENWTFAWFDIFVYKLHVSCNPNLFNSSTIKPLMIQNMLLLNRITASNTKFSPSFIGLGHTVDLFIQFHYLVMHRSVVDEPFFLVLSFFFVSWPIHYYSIKHTFILL